MTGWQRAAAVCVLTTWWWGGVPTRAAPGNLTNACVDHFDAGVDYFPDKAAIEDATNFRVEYRKSYKLVTLTEGDRGIPPQRYILVQCGAPAPPLSGDLTGAQILTVPIKSLFALSTTHLSLLVGLGRLDVLTGVAQFDPVTTPDVDARIKTGLVTEFAKNGLAIDVERVVTAKPSVLMSTGSSGATLSVIRAAGVPVVANAEWLEPSALARAEWLKYMALFLNEERHAQSLYSAIKGRYRSLSTRALAGSETGRPLVMTGRSTRGVFTIAGGRSYVAALIKDAGGRYAWADNPALGSATVDFEAQIQRAANADVWINGGGWKSLADMLNDEPRYAVFKAYREGQVWTYERRLTATGANDYWARSVTHPDLLLADLVRIFHPRAIPDRAFEWYLQLAAR